MSPTISKAFGLANALIFLVLGIICIIDPIALLSKVDVAATSVSGVIELRTLYGGLELAIALYIVFLVVKNQSARVFEMCTIFYAGLFVTRAILMLLSQTYGTHLMLAGAELTGLLLNAWLWRGYKDPSGSSKQNVNRPAGAMVSARRIP